MGRIQTGVDKLVALVKEKQRVSIDDAAKALGVSKTIIQEWADFLEEEALVEIKYSLAKTYLIDRKLTKTESVAKERQFEQQRETFVTKVDQSIGAIEHEATGFEQFRKEFQTLKSDLGASLKAVQGELGKLKTYEHERARVTKDIHSERDRIAKDEAAASAAIKREYKRYHDVIHQIAQEERSLSEHKKRVHAVIVGEQAASKKLADYQKLLQTLRDRARHEAGSIGANARTIGELQRSARAIKQDILGIEKTRLQPLVALRDRHEAKLKALERTILEKAARERKHSRNPAGGTVAARRKLEEFFRRKKVVEHLLEAIEHDKRSLLVELEDLEKRAEAYRVGKNAAKLDELRKRLKSLEDGKARLHEHIQSFLKTLR